jgi:GGDEF domain-containing protein
VFPVTGNIFADPANLGYDPFQPLEMISALEQQLQSLLQENAQLKVALSEARQQNYALCQCRTFEILTNAGLGHEWRKIAVGHPCFSIIYLDIDDLKGLNRRHSIAGANQKIHAALSCVRQTEIVGRVLSGDEIAVIVQGSQVYRVHERLQRSFAEQGISFTAAIGQCFYPDLARNLEPLIREVEQVKNARSLKVSDVVCN